MGQTSMLTLYTCVSGGLDWYDIYELLTPVGHVHGMGFVLYITFYTISVWNVMTSIFVEQIMILAEPDAELRALERQKQDLKDAGDMLRLVKRLDVDNSDTISFEEICKFIQEPSLRKQFEVRGLTVHDTAMFFHLLEAASGSAEISLQNFAVGCMKLKGMATSLDLHIMSMQHQKWQHRLIEALSALNARVERSEARLMKTVCANAPIQQPNESQASLIIM